MYYDVVAEFRYTNKYKQARKDRQRLKYIIKYRTAL